MKERGLCLECGKYPQKRHHRTSFSKYCGSCERRKWETPETRIKRLADKEKNRPTRNYGYQKYKTDTCVRCGFCSPYRCQLDVDHIDGNHFNNDPSNLQTLCANCHRLKTYLAKEGIHVRVTDVNQGKV